MAAGRRRWAALAAGAAGGAAFAGVIRRHARALLGWAAVVPVLTGLTAVVLLSAPAPAVQRDAAAGEALFQANCAVCHGPNAEGSGAAPPLGGVVDRLGSRAVEAVIRDGRRGMPAWGDRLAEGDIRDVVAYLDTLPTAPAARQRRHGPMMEGMSDGMMGGAGWLWMLLWALLSIALLVLVTVAVVWLVRSLGAGSGRQQPAEANPPDTSAREALDVRYARGELSRDQYLQARRDLEGPPS
jgi:putative membrane protein